MLWGSVEHLAFANAAVRIQLYESVNIRTLLVLPSACILQENLRFQSNAMVVTHTSFNNYKNSNLIDEYEKLTDSILYISRKERIFELDRVQN